ncbi:MAG: STT3 domain-containing protein, partial [Candidatus Cloacimonadota bacterium]|nr:STT3 domain-containing protein [Candidatus Cloacimonadota bacterium]
MNFLNIESEEQFNSIKYVTLFIIVSYTFSFLIRMIWIYQFQDNPSFLWNDQLMINTNDGYYFASAAQHLLNSMHDANPQIPIALKNYPGVIYVTALATKLLPFSLETVILYLPAVISSLVVIPIILTTRLFGLPLLGFFAALLGSIAWSYYNRTMVGYYDSDMFSVLMQMMVVYSFISLLVQHRYSNIILAFVFITFYPLFYPQGLSLIYAMYFIYLAYVYFTTKDDKITYLSIAVIAVALAPLSIPLKLVLGIALLLLYRFDKIALKQWMFIAALAFLFYLFNANVFGLIYEKIFGYFSRGTETEGLAFYQVIQTVREAGQIPFSTMANRISGSTFGVIIALIGYLFLAFKYRPFIIALPLIGVGVFSLVGGLRFTVYAVPIAAVSAIFLFYIMTQSIIIKKLRYGII